MQETIYLELSKFYRKLSKDFFEKYLQVILKTGYSKDTNLKAKIYKQGLFYYNKILLPKYNQGLRSIIISKNIFLEKYIHFYYKKIWKGQNLKNKTLFIFYYYSGFGDCIQYCRYFHIIKIQKIRLIIEVPENLFSLYQYNFPNCEIILAQGKEYKGKYDYTYHHELFLNLQKDLETFPNPEGYLSANPTLVQQMKDTGIFNTDKKKVGIFWQSASGINNYRSIPTEEIIPILENKNIQFYSLTKEAPDKETQNILEKYNVIACAPYINNAHDTAAIMKNLDLVISTDSFPIHLAGALAIKAYLILPFDNDWRWFNETEKTAWYDSVRIFKQTIPNKWNDVIQRIADNLNTKINLLNKK